MDTVTMLKSVTPSSTDEPPSPQYLKERDCCVKYFDSWSENDQVTTLVLIFLDICGGGLRKLVYGLTSHVHFALTDIYNKKLPGICICLAIINLIDISFWHFSTMCHASAGDLHWASPGTHVSLPARPDQLLSQTHAAARLHLSSSRY